MMGEGGHCLVTLLWGSKKQQQEAGLTDLALILHNTSCVQTACILQSHLMSES